MTVVPVVTVVTVVTVLTVLTVMTEVTVVTVVKEVTGIQTKIVISKFSKKCMVKNFSNGYIFGIREEKKKYKSSVKMFFMCATNCHKNCYDNKIVFNCFWLKQKQNKNKL